MAMKIKLLKDMNLLKTVMCLGMIGTINSQNGMSMENASNLVGMAHQPFTNGSLGEAYNKDTSSASSIMEDESNVQPLTNGTLSKAYENYNKSAGKIYDPYDYEQSNWIYKNEINNIKDKVDELKKTVQQDEKTAD